MDEYTAYYKREDTHRFCALISRYAENPRQAERTLTEVLSGPDWKGHFDEWVMQGKRVYINENREQIYSLTEVNRSKSRHTPGPWHTNASDLDNIEWEICHDVEGRTYSVADVLEGEESDANARLIAAAPDLLDALTDAVKWAYMHALKDHHLKDGEDILPPEYQTKWLAALNKVGIGTTPSESTPAHNSVSDDEAKLIAKLAAKYLNLTTQPFDEIHGITVKLIRTHAVRRVWINTGGFGYLPER